MMLRIASFLIFVFSMLKVQSQIQYALEVPEYNFLYKNYKNKIFPSSKDGIVLTPYVKDSLKNVYIEEFEQEGRKGFTIQPRYLGNLTVKFPVANEKGKIIGTDSIEFSIRPIPDPILLTSSVSKSSGSRIFVGQGASSPIVGIYDVISIEVQGVGGGFCVGNIIPGALVPDLELGTEVNIVFIYKDPFTGVTYRDSGTLKVTN
jgi:hypothetical protein